MANSREDQLGLIPAFFRHGQCERKLIAGPGPSPPKMVVATPLVLGKRAHVLATSIAARLDKDLHRLTLDRAGYASRCWIDRRLELLRCLRLCRRHLLLRMAPRP